MQIKMIEIDLTIEIDWLGAATKHTTHKTIRIEFWKERVEVGETTYCLREQEEPKPSVTTETSGMASCACNNGRLGHVVRIIT